MSASTHQRPTVLLLGSLDTKAAEYDFARRCLEAAGVSVLVADFGILADPNIARDVTASEIAELAGTTLAELRQSKDVHGARAKAIDLMASGASLLTETLWREGRCQAVLGLGGGEGSTVISAAMRALPLGVPKLLVSTMMPSNMGAYFGLKDITVMYSVTDIAGLNRVSRRIIANAAAAAAGMATFPAAPRFETLVTDAATTSAPLIGITMFGTTTRGATQIKTGLEQLGFETVVFHAVGSGGAAMEEMIWSGDIDGVIDLTPSEITDELMGGIFTAGPHRMEAAGEMGLPQVVVPGAVGQITFGAADSVPSRFSGDDRKQLVHNPSVTIIRANAEECTAIADAIADKLLLARGPVAVALPLGGLSDYEEPAGPLGDAEADAALFTTLEERLSDSITVVEDASDINSAEFARRVVGLFVEVWSKRNPMPTRP